MIGRVWVLLFAFACSATALLGQKNDASIDLLDVRGLPVAEALDRLLEVRRLELVLRADLLPGRTSSCLTRDADGGDALRCVLAGTGLDVRELPSGAFVIVASDDAPRAATLEGRVVTANAGLPIPGADVSVEPFGISVISDARGRFRITSLPPGPAQVSASLLGFGTSVIEAVLADGDTARVSLELVAEPIALSEIVVTPGQFSLAYGAPEVRQTLSPRDMRNVPQLGEDAYRAVVRLPGLANTDFSAKFTVRGGDHEETLVTLDGLELYDPVHLKEIDGGTLSIIDVESIGAIDMMTGAFPAEYGDHLSGVFTIRSSENARTQGRTSLGISFLNARVLSEDSFADGRGDWLILGRRGYLDLVLGFVQGENTLTPTYYDAFTKVHYRFGDRHDVSFQTLYSHDDFLWVDDEDPNDRAHNRYSSRYGWVNWRTRWTPALTTRTVFSGGRLGRDRQGQEVALSDGEFNFEVSDVRGMDFWGLNSHWNLDVGRRLHLKAGLDVRGLRADYDYSNRQRIEVAGADSLTPVRFDSTAATLARSGIQFGTYVAARTRISNGLTTELGLRFDRTTWTDESVVSPRINLAYQLSDATDLRAGWGLFRQAQGIHELQVEDGDAAFHPSERAEHRVLGLEHRVSGGLVFRIDAYDKVLSNQRPYYANLLGLVELFPEVVEDRHRIAPGSGFARGLEFFVKRASPERLNGWASYSVAVTKDQVDGVDIPKSFDQRHTVYLDLSYEPSTDWGVNAAWQYHSGRPFTSWTADPVYDEGGALVDLQGRFEAVHGGRLPSYHRLDVRLNRIFNFERSRLAVFGEVRNLYNRENVRAYVYDVGLGDTQLDIRRTTEPWFPLMPSFGVRWDILH